MRCGPMTKGEGHNCAATIAVIAFEPVGVLGFSSSGRAWTATVTMPPTRKAGGPGSVVELAKGSVVDVLEPTGVLEMALGAVVLGALGRLGRVARAGEREAPAGANVARGTLRATSAAEARASGSRRLSPTVGRG